MNLTGILSDCYRRLNYPSVPVVPVVTRLTAFVNETYRELVAMPGMDKVRDDVMPITAYANQARTGLPPVVARIYAITDRANQLKLTSVNLSQLRLVDPGQITTGGYPIRYASIGNQAVFRQPATSGIWVASSSASDVTQKAFAETVITGGYPNPTISGGTAINGVTRVQIGTLATHIEVTKFYIDLVCVGSISLFDAAAAGNELARIPVGQTNARHWAIEWFPIQTADTTEYMDYQRQLYDLVNGTDEPVLPIDFHPLVAIGARMKEYEYLDDSRLGAARELYIEGKSSLREFATDDGDRLSSLRPKSLRWSRLGGNYPADIIVN